jgi:chemotaxis protein MotB
MFRTVTLLLALSLPLTGCMQKKIRGLEDDVAQRDLTIQQLREENVGYTIQIDSLRGEIASLKQKNQELASVYDALTQEFAPQVASGDAEFVIFKDRSVITLGEGLMFPTGSAELTDGGRDQIAKMADVIKQHPNRRFQVEGHTDSQPIANTRFPSNWELGSARAVAVVKQLVADGVPSEQLSAATYADTSPIAANEGDDGMAQNRRIALSLQTSVSDTGAQTALYQAAKDHGGAKYAYMANGEPGNVATAPGDDR